MTEDNLAPCPHCTSMIAVQATRCPRCAGDIRFCPKCDSNQAAVVREVWKGALRGGRQRQIKCGRCDKVLEGSRW